MKLSLLLLSLFPLFVVARHREEDVKEQHAVTEKQYIRKVQQPQAPIVTLDKKSSKGSRSPAMAPTISGFIENDINLSFLFALLERLNGVPIDPTIIDVLLPPEGGPPPPAAVIPPPAPIQTLPANPFLAFLGPQPPPAPVVPPATPFQPQPANNPSLALAGSYFGRARNPAFGPIVVVNGGPSVVILRQPAIPAVGGPSVVILGWPAIPAFGGPSAVIVGQPTIPSVGGLVTTNTGCSNGQSSATITGGSSSFAIGPSAQTSNSGTPAADCGPTVVSFSVAQAPSPSPICSGCRRLRFRRVNLLQILDEPGDFTFFAPTNDAFTLLPQELLEVIFLQDEFIPHLEDLLLYHGLDGKRLAADFLDVEIIEAFNTEGVLVRQNPLRVNAIPVVRTNINASNGVTHVIGGVLAPDWVANSILGFVRSTADLSILFELLEIAGLDNTLDKFGDEFTFVAPTNDAFTVLGDAVLDSLRNPDNMQALQDILEYHVIIGVFTSPELSDGDSLTTRQGGSVEVLVDDDIMIMFNQATVVSSDSILANNGVLYKIDAVLNPDSVAGF